MCGSHFSKFSKALEINWKLLHGALKLHKPCTWRPHGPQKASQTSIPSTVTRNIKRRGRIKVFPFSLRRKHSRLEAQWIPLALFANANSVFYISFLYRNSSVEGRKRRETKALKAPGERNFPVQTHYRFTSQPSRSHRALLVGWKGKSNWNWQLQTVPLTRAPRLTQSL